MKRNKIALIGGGNIGGNLAYLSCIKELGDIVLFDVVEGMPQGKAQDIMHGGAIFNSSVNVTGTNNFADIAGADVVIVTAGIPRKPGMSRDDLIATNAGIMKAVAKNIKIYAANAFVIVVSNPLDAMVTLCQKESGLAPNMVVGMAGVLDSGRYRTWLAEALNTSPASIHALVLGGHGDDMVPIRSKTTVNGIPVESLLSTDKLDAIEKRVCGAGGEIVALLKIGSAFYSPAAAAIEMAESYLKDQKKVLPCAAYLTGQYGEEGIYLGVPVKIGAGGVEKIIEIDLTAKEKEALSTSASRVRELVALLPN
ncbi:MAG: malate dehydrogenase [Deltaproteobacteria bacterium]|nr:malate dehydrogenase [Deltaproteobacteria bacterium]